MTNDKNILPESAVSSEDVRLGYKIIGSLEAWKPWAQNGLST